MENAYNKIWHTRLFTSLSLITILSFLSFQNMNAISSATFWNSTAKKVVRGSHWETLSFNRFNKVKTNLSVDLFGETSMLWTDKRPVLLEHVFDLYTLVADVKQKALSAIKKSDNQELALLASICDPFEILKNVSGFKEILVNGEEFLDALNFEEHRFGLMTHFSMCLADNWWGGIDIPIVQQITHFGDKNNDIQNLKDLGEKLQEVDLAGFLFTVNEEDLILITQHLSKRSSGQQLGDLRFYLETELCDQNPICSTILGLEVFMAPSKNEAFIPAALSSKKPLLSSKKLINDCISFYNHQSDAAVTATLRNEVLSFADNFFSTLEATYLNTDCDQMRPGLGVYLAPSAALWNERVEIFAKLRGNYLFETNKVTIFALKNYDSLENVAFIAKHKPLSILQLDLGLGLHFGNVHFYCGYDFYLQSKALIGEILAPYDDTYRDLQPYLAKSLAAQVCKYTRQSRVFSSLGYKNTTNKDATVDFSCAISGSLSFASSQDIFDKTGLAISVGFGF